MAFGGALATALADHKGRTLHNGPGSFVFCKRDGSALQPDVLRWDVLYPTLDRLQIPRPTRAGGFHAFRHSAGSYINSETGNLKLAQRLPGHSTLSTPGDIYTHTTPEAERKAALAIERAIYGNLFANVREIANTSSTRALN
jgi:site-specific recombinase XerD